MGQFLSGFDISGCFASTLVIPTDSVTPDLYGGEKGGLEPNKGEIASLVSSQSSHNKTQLPPLLLSAERIIRKYCLKSKDTITKLILFNSVSLMLDQKFI